MGFYFDLQASSGKGLYQETRVPTYFWGLFAFAGFALACMYGAAYSVMGDLAKVGTRWDKLVLFTILMSLPLYLLVGLKLLLVRKEVRFFGSTLEIGFRFGERFFWKKSVDKANVAEVCLENQKPAPNLAPRQHRDSQYFIRGHWRVRVIQRNGKAIAVDKHTERGALEPLYDDLTAWSRG